MGLLQTHCSCGFHLECSRCSEMDEQAGTFPRPWHFASKCDPGAGGRTCPRKLSWIAAGTAVISSMLLILLGQMSAKGANTAWLQGHRPGRAWSTKQIDQQVRPTRGTHFVHPPACRVAEASTQMAWLASSLAGMASWLMPQRIVISSPCSC